MDNLQFEWNARTQITMWFDNTELEASLLRDYGMQNIQACLAYISMLQTSQAQPIKFQLLEDRTSYKVFVDSFFVSFSLGNKYWSGLLRDYYGPRAAIYFKYLIESLEEGKGFNLKAWRREWIKLTNSWQSSRNVFPLKSRGNALNVSQWLFQKYLQDLGSHDH